MNSITFFTVLLFVVAAAATSNAPPVKVALYFESLCPYCQDFITGSQHKAWVAEGVADIMSLDYYPYGNAKETQNGTSYTFSCQHGANECTGNLIETCAIKILQDQKLWYPFIYCLESGDVTKDGKTCATSLGINWDPISACANGTQGNQYEHEMAVATNNLVPAHTYVPWIIINDISHNDDLQNWAQQNLLSLVCYLYTGTKPAGCYHAQPYRPLPTPISVQ
eukprot:TRINITY_DN209_c0_g1_i2.p1 TRINITY_DN209_c0_g1~~TRINITY_DN209_c0_g1_i2.p1  ORF type:complete len:223 (-),score=35.87 TRINITY_DN209_c0_g1_i2:88-756(-)